MKAPAFLHCFSASTMNSCNIIVSWLVGYISGTFSSQHIQPEFFSSISFSGFSFRAFLCLLMLQTIPVLVIWISAKVGLHCIVLLTVFLRSFGCGVSAAVIFILYRSAGWLVYRILFFSDTFTSLVFLWLSLKQSNLKSPLSNWIYVFASMLIVSVCLLDLLLFSKFSVLF